jgi:hypothetical protein
MSTSLKISGGDLSIGSGRSYERVSGAYKLAQDLRLWVLEQIGTDPATPTFGSRLDGGVIDGVETPSYIGQVASPAMIADIRSEVISLLSQYQAGQIAKMQREMLAYGGKHTLSADETLQNVVSVDTSQIADQIIVRVICMTLAGTQFRLTIPTQV